MTVPHDIKETLYQCYSEAQSGWSIFTDVCEVIRKKVGNNSNNKTRFYTYN